MATFDSKEGFGHGNFDFAGVKANLFTVTFNNSDLTGSSRL